MRKLREARTGKQHLLGNLTAERGMKEFHQFGRSKRFEERSFIEMMRKPFGSIFGSLEKNTKIF